MLSMERLGRKWVTALGAMSLSLLLIGCGGPYPDMSNYDLQEALWKCKSHGPGDVTPAMGIKCDNINRECEVRRKSGRISTC